MRGIDAFGDSRDAWGRAKTTPTEPCVTDYFRVEGEEIREVAIGPVLKNTELALRRTYEATPRPES